MGATHDVARHECIILHEPSRHCVVEIKSKDLHVTKSPIRKDMLVAVFHPIVTKDIAALIVAGAILTTAVKLAAVGALSRHIVYPVLQSATPESRSNN